MSNQPETLADALAQISPPPANAQKVGWGRRIIIAVLTAAVWTAFFAVLSWSVLARPDMGMTVWMLLGVLGLVWLGLTIWDIPNVRRRLTRKESHFLLADDQQGFMGALRLDANTALLDGSNIYHFGHDNGLNGKPLRLMVQQLRAEGYRIVCFFDANIFYTLVETGAYPDGQRHSHILLMKYFGLNNDEVYVVKSGVQADKYVMSCLKHLPISFAVSNDQFRDFAKTYASVMKGDQWRKGITLKGNEIKLHKFKFQTPVRTTDR